MTFLTHPVTRRQCAPRASRAGYVVATALALGLAPGLTGQAQAQAQNRAVPESSGRLAVVEFRDSSLFDALDLLFSAAGISRQIDSSARDVRVADMTVGNVTWNEVAIRLTSQHGYRLSRDRASGIYLVEPRVPVGDLTGEGGEFAPRAGRGGGAIAPTNPFGARGQNQLNFQVRPNIGGVTGGAATATGAGTPLPFTPIIVRHVYVGGIAQLFNNSAIIRTEQFVSPETGGQGGAGGGRGGQGGGIGGGIGGGGGLGGGIGGIGGGGQGGGIGGIGGGGQGGGFGGGFGF